MTVDAAALDKICSMKDGETAETCTVKKGELKSSKSILAVGGSYGVIKFTPANKDPPHWSLNGK